MATALLPAGASGEVILLCPAWRAAAVAPVFRRQLLQLLHHLACRGFYVQHTDHLSDRALYEVLWKKGLREEAILPGRSRTGRFSYDTIGSYSHEDMEIFHRCYESETDRARHLAKYRTKNSYPARSDPSPATCACPRGRFKAFDALGLGRPLIRESQMDVRVSSF